MHTTRLLLQLCLLGGAVGQASTPGQDRDPPAADPARPTVTNPAHIPPPGYLQFEQGFLQANDSQSLDHQSSIVHTTKLSLNHYLMVQALDQPFAHTAQPPGTNDTGDLLLGAQVLFNDLVEGHGAIPTVALQYDGLVRAGTSPNLDVGSYTQGVSLLASGTNLGLHYDANLVVNEQDAGLGHRRAQYGQTVALTRQITSPFNITGELWHFTQPTVFSTRNSVPVARANAVGLLFAGGYSLRPNLVLDCGFEHGLTSTSTAWQGFAGLTYLLPHRLWKSGRR